MAEPGPSQLETISYMDGLTSDGRLNAVNGGSWDGTTPATYNLAEGTAHKWGGDTAGTAGGTVTYAFDPGSGFSAAATATYVAAMTLWSDEANISFAPAASLAAADLTFFLSNTSTTVPINAGRTYTVSVGGTGTPDSTILSTDLKSSVVFNTGGGFGDPSSFTVSHGYGVSAVVHELGHVLGLDHSGPYNGTVNPNTQQQNPTDNRLWTIMSYTAPDNAGSRFFSSDPVSGTDWQGASSSTTPQMLDILAAQQLYGMPTHTALSGGQVFGFNCNISDASRLFFDFTVNVDPIVTLWDAGAGNTLDLSGFYTNSTVNLTPGTFSSCDGMTNNIGIAYGTAIDKAIGGSGNDSFTLNTDSDVIDGGSGNNTAIVDAPEAAYRIVRTPDGSVSLSNGSVTDTLTNIQTIQFVVGSSDSTVLVSDLPVSAGSFVWKGGSGSVSNASSWLDASGAAAASAPGAEDIATIAGPGTAAPQTVSGNGKIGQLLFTGLTGITGSIAADRLAIGAGGSTATVTIAPGAGALTSRTAAIANGTLSVIGRLLVQDTMALAPTDSSASATLSVQNGGVAQVGTLALAGGAITLQSGGVVEVGFGGGAVAGTVTVDAERELSGYGTLGRLVDNGLVEATGGVLAIRSGTLSGSGRMMIGSGSVLALNVHSDTVPVAFADATGVLQLNGSGNVTVAQISGFQPGDVIELNNSNAASARVDFDPETGGLTVSDVSGSTSNTLFSSTLAGDVSNDVILLQPGSSTGTYTLQLAQGSLSGSQSPSKGAGGDDIGWNAAGPGDWNRNANWTDTETNRHVAPGSKDQVSINGGPAIGTYDVISGNGDAATLQLLGKTAFSGAVTAGSVSIGATGNAATTLLIGDASLTSSTVTINTATLAVSADATLAVAGALTLIGDATQAGPSLQLFGGAAAQIGSLVVSGSGTGTLLSVDAASSLEIGTDGDAQAGVLTIDAAHTLSGNGDLSTLDMTSDGTITSIGGTLSLGTVDGTGAMVIDSGSTLSVAGGTSNTVSFDGPDAALALGANKTPGVITGFAPGDSITTEGLPGTVPGSVVYVPGTGGAATLNLNGLRKTQISLKLVGNFSGQSFVLSQPTPYTATVTLQSGAWSDFASSDQFAGAAAARIAARLAAAGPVTSIGSTPDGTLLANTRSGLNVELLTAPVAGSAVSLTSGYGALVAQGTSGVTLTGTTSGALLVANAGDDALQAGAAGQMLIGGTGDDTLTGSTGGDVLIAGAGDQHVIAGAGPDTVFAGSGSTTITGGSVGCAIHGGSGACTIDGGGGDDTIQAGSGSLSVTANGSSEHVLGSAGTMSFLGGAASSTVQGGVGSVTVHGGSGGGSFIGGSAGHNLLASDGNASLWGGGAGDVLVGAHDDLLVAANGVATLTAGNGNNETLVDANGTTAFAGAGQDNIFGSTGGTDVIVGGTGDTTVVGRGGDTIVYGAKAGGTLTDWAGSSEVTQVAEAGRGDFIVGSSASVLWIGTGNGAQTITAQDGGSGGSLDVQGFRPGIDQLALNGYSSDQIKQGMVGGNLVVTLSDHTTLTFSNVSTLV